MLKVRDKPNLFRDPYSKAIIVDDPVSRTNYTNHKAIAIQTQQATTVMRQEVDQLKQDVTEIKQLLQAIASKL